MTGWCSPGHYVHAQEEIDMRLKFLTMNVPFVTGRITGESASVNNPFQTIERRDMWISLQVVPVVTPEGLLIIDVKTSADSISDYLVASDIFTNTRAISTTIQLKSGQTVLLGSMVDNRDSQAEASVPWIPKFC